MTIDAYVFPVDNQCVFICEEQEITGQQWAKECIELARHISGYSQRNWLLYQDDFYQYSQYFFALLLANKNIVLAQSNQFERFQQAAKIADISIGNIGLADSQQETLLPHFSQNKNNYLPTQALATLAINGNCSITLFTSGSTGEAKAIKKYWYQLANEVDTLQRFFSQDADLVHSQQQACVLSTVTHKHIYGLLFKLIWPVFSNKKIICETIEYPEQVEYYCQRFNHITFISSPSYLARTNKHFSAQVGMSISEVFCSGGALSASVASDFLKYSQKQIIEIYGSTETGGIAWRQQTIDTRWQLFPDHQVILADDSTLVLTSNFLVKGETFKTDDRVELTGRYFNLLGRVDRIIKLHEKRLSLDEMEHVLLSMTQVKACHCFILDTTAIKKAQLVTVIQLVENHAVPESLVQKKHLVNAGKKALLSLFDASLLPRKWRFVQQLPFNSQGKLVKAELVKLFK